MLPKLLTGRITYRYQRLLWPTGRKENCGLKTECPSVLGPQPKSEWPVRFSKIRWQSSEVTGTRDCCRPLRALVVDEKMSRTLDKNFWLRRWMRGSKSLPDTYAHSTTKYFPLSHLCIYVWWWWLRFKMKFGNIFTSPRLIIMFNVFFATTCVVK